MTTEPTPRKGTPRPGNGGPRPNAGGARPGAGRNPSEIEYERIMVMLTPEQIAKARQLGGGGPRDLSKGIRRALESCKT